MSGVLSREFAGYAGQSSMIRRMFEAGIKLKLEHGADKVCDFSLGNPDLPPPAEVAEGMRAIAREADQPFAFGYMPNAGFPWALELLAGELTREQGVRVEPSDVMLAGGAAGAMNSFLRAVLEPGDEVLGVLPYFVDYGFYAANFGGIFKAVPAKADFSLDVPAIEAAITKKTRVMLINSPNNPTGQIYSEAELTSLAAVLRRKSAENGRPVFLALDEPYRFLAFEGTAVPSVLPLYEYSVAVSSFSKSLSLPGERLGYLVAANSMPDKNVFMGGVIMASRVLGFVNAPVVGQKLLKYAIGKQADLSVYAKRRTVMAAALADAGYEFTSPKGAFYFFPKAPGGDDAAFVELLADELILAVPGRGFGLPGYFRLAFCVGEEVIRRAAPGFKRALLAVKQH
ncbi:MAG: pyridoxal phosphate-dependent aminotransferase [Deltaproteobacteria bacterium]|nr:pyridoxal phosphate-dependent aminotransferase [Deltaproteobacteria bacterium]